MTALVTGASSGLGRAMALNLAKRGFDLVITARRRQRLIELKKEITGKHGVRVKILCHDLSKTEECYALFDEVKRADIDIVINNAGFGVFGRFADTDLEAELKMIDVNIKAVHILTKLFLRRFRKKNSGHILNVASLAGFMAGPYFSSYYAAKNYVVQLTKAIHEELKNEGSNVYIGAFCPGPVNTEFNETAGADFVVNGMNDRTAAAYAIEKMLDGQMMILPGIMPKLAVIASRWAPQSLMLTATGMLQRARRVHECAEVKPPEEEAPETSGDVPDSRKKYRLTDEELDLAKKLK